MARIGLIGCVKSKLSNGALARDLYTSPLFRGRPAWVERTCDRWFILSAQHGLIDPATHLEPYDLALSRVRASARRMWSAEVLAAFSDQLGPLHGLTFEAHAGIHYLEFGLGAGLVHAGATVVVPMQGLSQGRQLARYRDASRDEASAFNGPVRTTSLNASISSTRVLERPALRSVGP